MWSVLQNFLGLRLASLFPVPNTSRQLYARTFISRKTIMNGFAPPNGMPFPPPGGMPPPARNTWRATTTADGRTYYYNSETNVTQWTKPEELKSNEERATEGTEWQMHEANGKPYWAHSVTKQTRWDPPPEVQEKLDRMVQPPRPGPP